MTLLDWLVVATVAAIVLVLLDGLRRKWMERRNQVVMKLDRNTPQEDIDLDLIPNSELPNGGARTITRDSDPTPNLRKRNIRLKDGREQRRGEAGNFVPPVLMDPVEVEEESIEHANVYVKAEVLSADLDESLVDDDLPPEVLAGLDSEFDDDAAVKATPAASDKYEDDEEYDDAPHLESLEDDEDDELLDAEEDDELEDDDEEQFESAPEDEEYLDDEEDDEEEEEEEENEEAQFDLEPEGEVERFEPELDDEEEELASAEVDEEDYEPVARDKQFVADDSRAYDDAGEEPADDEEYADEYSEDDYENEPTLLEGAYRKAASHFQRPAEPEVPRVEPGFGEVPAEDVEADEDFSSAFDDKLMNEILDEEQAEIRAWRTQSVTQRDVPEPEPVADKRKSRSKPAVESPAPKVRHAFFAAEPPESDLREADAVSEPLLEEKASPPAKKSREPRKGFWEAVTGKAPAKPAGKPAAPKINQGELFQEESVEEPEPLEEPGPQEVIIINVMARPGQYFRGDELLPLVQRYGMRLGNMSIFHRHADHSATGPVMFSMANMVKPGTFSLSNVEEFATPGISFFVQLPNKFGNMKSFEQMLATAEGIKQALGGDLKDERRSVFTRQTVEHCRQRIRDFELSLLAKK